jgi:succinyl-CoA synthetase beta subunit
MNIHEYQAKELLAKFGVPIPAGYAALSVDEAVAAAGSCPGRSYVVKAQIHAGGRGKGKFKELGPDAKGGVRLSKTIEDVRANARGHARQHAGDDPDRRGRQAGATASTSPTARTSRRNIISRCWSTGRPAASR